MVNDVYSYTVSNTASESAFARSCKLIESSFKGIIKENTLVDVDGSSVKIYHKNGAKIKVCNDYEVDAVYVDSEIELNDVF